MAKLVYPSFDYKESHLDALREGFTQGVGRQTPLSEIEKLEDDTIFQNYLNALNDQTGEVECPDGITRPKISHDLYWLVLDQTFIGSVSFRHELSDLLIHYGGHIGYGIRPAWKGQGYGKKMVALTLEKAKEQGLDKVLITCSPDNPASRGIIEANGGVLEDIRDLSWTTEKIMRFWIDLS